MGKEKDYNDFLKGNVELVNAHDQALAYSFKTAGAFRASKKKWWQKMDFETSISILFIFLVSCFFAIGQIDLAIFFMLVLVWVILIHRRNS